MTQPYCTGPVYLITGTGNGGLPQLLGFSQGGLTIDTADEFEPFMNDVAGSRVPMDMQYQGSQAFISGIVNRWNEATFARIEALQRRSKNIEGNHLLMFDDLKLDTWSKTAERAGKQITLTAKEYQLLELFLRNPNKILSREYIAEQVWEIGFDTGTNFIDVYVNYLRKKIEKDFKSKLIHTVIGMGYILKQANR